MKKNSRVNTNKIKFPFWLISLLLPPVGVILYFIKKKNDIKGAKNIFTSCIIGFCIYAFALLIILNNIPKRTVKDWYEDVKSNKQVVTVLGLTTCPHCQELKPVINKLSKKYGFNLYFFEVDKLSSEDNTTLLNTYELKDYDEHVPFTFIINNNEYESGVIGFGGEEALKEYLVDNGVIKKD